MDSSIVVVFGSTAVLHDGRHSLSLGGELEADERFRDVFLSFGLDINLESLKQDEHGLLSGRSSLCATGCVARNCL